MFIHTYVRIYEHINESVFATILHIFIPSTLFCAHMKFSSSLCFGNPISLISFEMTSLHHLVYCLLWVLCALLCDCCDTVFLLHCSLCIKASRESKMQDSLKQIIQFRNGIDSCVQKSKMVLDCLCVLEGLFGEYHSSSAALGDGYPGLNLC